MSYGFCCDKRGRIIDLTDRVSGEAHEVDHKDCLGREPVGPLKLLALAIFTIAFYLALGLLGFAIFATL